MKKADLMINKDYRIGEISENLMGSFIEHMGKAVYTGIYEPTHKTANKDGFRQDVIDFVKDLKVPVVRYPGGNFLSGYDWKNGIGPIQERKPTLDLAWGQLEPNKVGVLEFDKWAKSVGTNVMMAVNMGTGTPKDAAELVEYCNHKGGSYWSDLRIKHGQKEPLNIKQWCVGNEMDGNWQICALTADEYGRKARETAKMMKWVDNTIETVVCGSSGPQLDTYPTWDRVVLEHTYDYMDYISLHRYYEYPNHDRTRINDILGSYLDLDKFIKTISSTCDYVKALKRSKKTMKLSIDEWNIWHTNVYNDINVDKWQIGPPRVENKYDMIDAVAFSGLMLALINNVDRVKLGCLAQLVNVIAPIMTEPNGRSCRQTIYYPYLYGCHFAKGETLRTQMKCDTIESMYGDNPMVYSATTIDEKSGELTLFAVNNNSEEDMELNINLQGFSGLTMTENICISSKDPTAQNTFDKPNNIVPTYKKVVKVDNEKSSIVLDKLSFNVIRFKFK